MPDQATILELLLPRRLLAKAVKLIVDDVSSPFFKLDLKNAMNPHLCFKLDLQLEFGEHVSSLQTYL